MIDGDEGSNSDLQMAAHFASGSRFNPCCNDGGRVNIVEAIDRWVDAQIDNLSDDELAGTLEVLDVISAHELAEFDTYHLREHEFDELIDQFDDPDERRLADTMIIGGLAQMGVQRSSKLVANMQPPAAGAASHASGAVTSPVGLAPAFLGSADMPPPARSPITVSKLTIALTVIFAFGAFAIGAISLFESLEEAPDDAPADIATTADTDTDRDASEPPLQTTTPATPTQPAVAEVPSATPEPTPLPATPEPTAAEVTAPTSAVRALIRDDRGNVYAQPSAGTMGAASLLVYGAASEQGLPPAAQLRSWDTRFAIITDTGGVRLVDPQGTSDDQLIWDTNNFEPAADAVFVGGTNVILTTSGEVLRFVGDESPNVDEPQAIWQDPPVASIDTNGRGLLAVLATGEVMVWSSLDDQPELMWDIAGKARATGAAMTSTAAIIALDGGVLQRHALDPLDVDGESVWLGSVTAEPWALSFAASDTHTAIVLDSYQVIVVEGDGTQSVIWDGTEGLPAPVDVSVVNDMVVALLDTGSVVALDIYDTSTTAAVWDISEADVPPARQPLLVDASAD